VATQNHIMMVPSCDLHVQPIPTVIPLT